MLKNLLAKNCEHKFSAADKFCSNRGFKITVIQKKHKIAVHKFVNYEPRKTMANSPTLTDRQLLEKYDNKKAEPVHLGRAMKILLL